MLNVQLRPTLDATVLRVFVNRIARCAAGLVAYQEADTIIICRISRVWDELIKLMSGRDEPIPAEMKAVSPWQLVSAIP